MRQTDIHPSHMSLDWNWNLYNFFVDNNAMITLDSEILCSNFCVDFKLRKASATHMGSRRDPDPKLIFSIRFTKPLYWWEKGGRDCGRLRRFGDSDTKDQLWISNRLCVAEALRSLILGSTLCFNSSYNRLINFGDFLMILAYNEKQAIKAQSNQNLSC